MFEWGSGYSTIYWSHKAKEVYAAEDNKDWFTTVEKKLKTGNVHLMLRQNENDYVNAIAENGGKYDVIVIDGRHRTACAKKSIEHLKEGGMIILDNSDWARESFDFLQSQDFIQADFFGLGPANLFMWKTTVFYSRNASWQPLNEDVIGGKNNREIN